MTPLCRSYLQGRARFELIFDPLGPVENPSPNSAYYSAGVWLDFAQFKTDAGQQVEYTYVIPYVKFTLLY